MPAQAQPWPPRSAYLHIPFCHRRCFYCDFPVVPLGDRAGGEAPAPGSASIAAYLALLLQEIAASPPGPPLATVYFGGGTPSLMPPALVAAPEKSSPKAMALRASVGSAGNAHS